MVEFYKDGRIFPEFFLIKTGYFNYIRTEIGSFGFSFQIIVHFCNTKSFSRRTDFRSKSKAIGLQK